MINIFLGICLTAMSFTVMATTDATTEPSLLRPHKTAVSLVLIPAVTHFAKPKRKGYKYNETPNGIGLSFQVNSNEAFDVGHYTNSFRRPSNYIVYSKAFNKEENVLRIGGGFGLVTGYRSYPIPLFGMAARVKIRSQWVQLLATPKFVALQVGFQLSH